MKNTFPKWMSSWRVLLPLMAILVILTFAVPKLNNLVLLFVIAFLVLLFFFRRALIGGTVNILGTRNANKYLFSEEYEQAVELATQQIAKHPKDIVAYLARSTAYMHLDKLQAARADCDAALALDPKSVYVYNNRAIISMQEDNLPAALADMQQALSIQPANPILLYNRGAVYGRMGNDEAAKKDYDKAIELEPDQAVTYTGRGFLSFKHEDLASALDDFKEAYDLSPETHQFSAALAVAEFAAGHVEAAQKRWQNLPAQYTHYADPDWQRRVLNWPDAMTVEAGKLIAEMEAIS